MPDYQGNPANKEPKPEKKIEKVVTGEVIKKPRSIPQKFKSIFFGGELKTSVRGVVGDVLLPAMRDTIIDAVDNGMQRLVYGETRYRRRRGPSTSAEYRPSVTYNNPIRRQYYGEPRERLGPPLPDQRMRRLERAERDTILLVKREDAERVVEQMIDIINQYDSASLADLYSLIGETSSPIDNKWGWTYLNNVEIRQTRDGWVIELPPMEAVT